MIKCALRCWYGVHANESHLHQVLINKVNSQIYSFNTEMLECRDSKVTASNSTIIDAGKMTKSSPFTRLILYGRNSQFHGSNRHQVAHERSNHVTGNSTASIFFFPRNINLPTLYLVPDTFIRTTSAAWAGLPACRRGVACDMTRFVSRPSLFLCSSSQFRV